MWITRVYFNKPLKDFADHLYTVNLQLDQLKQTGGGVNADSIDEEFNNSTRARQWTTIDLARAYLIFLKNKFDNNTDGIVFTSTLEEECWSDDSPSAVRIENPVKLETYQSTTNQI